MLQHNRKSTYTTFGVYINQPGWSRSNLPPLCGLTHCRVARCRYIQKQMSAPPGGDKLEFKREVRLTVWSEEGKRLKRFPRCVCWVIYEAFCWLIVPTGCLGTRLLWSCGHWESPGGEGIPPDAPSCSVSSCAHFKQQAPHLAFVCLLFWE